MDELPVELRTPHTRSMADATLGRRTVRALLARGGLQQLWPGVLVPGELALDSDARQQAALLFAGPEAALSGRSAAAVHGCSAARTPSVHLLLPYTRWVRSRNGLVVQHGPVSQRDVEVVRELRVLTLEATVADLLCRERARLALAIADQAAATFDAAVRGEFRRRIAQRLDTRPDRRGTARARHLLGLVTGKAESPPESSLRLLVVEAGYPAPDPQIPICDRQGRLRHILDMGWPDLRIALEYDGYEWHESRELADAERDEDLRRRGWWVIRVTADDLRDPTRLLTELTRAFRARGAPLRGSPAPKTAANRGRPGAGSQHAGR